MRCLARREGERGQCNSFAGRVSKRQKDMLKRELRLLELPLAAEEPFRGEGGDEQEEEPAIVVEGERSLGGLGGGGQRSGEGIGEGGDGGKFDVACAGGMADELEVLRLRGEDFFFG